MMATAPPSPARLLEAALYVPDLGAAEAFYGGVLGFERLLALPGRHVFFRVGDTVLLVFDPAATERPDPDARLPVPPHGARGPGHVCISATADDLARWRMRLAEAGVAIEAEVTWPNGARSIYVRDPAGNSVEFAEPRLWFDG